MKNENINCDLIICSDAIFTADLERDASSKGPYYNSDFHTIAGCVLIKDDLLEEVLDLNQAFEFFFPGEELPECNNSDKVDCGSEHKNSQSLNEEENFRLSKFIEKIGDNYPNIQVEDERGHLLTPGLIDSHTHLVHGGNRANELWWKLQGKDYMQIRELGGGIAATVRATRAASFDELKQKARRDLLSMLCHGSTVVEAKSGYGLDRDTELRQLEVVAELSKELPVKLVSTFLGAHDVPPEYKEKPKAYADFLIEEMFPLVKERGLAEFVDIFCEKGIFELEETERISKAALDLGFKLKIHADEIYSIGGAGLAARLGAVSAEHLMAISDEDIDVMASSQTVAVILPATSYYLMVKDFAPARKMLEKGVTVAIASDYNPGSSPCENLQTAMSRACFNLRMKPDEILRAVSINAAKALSLDNSYGSLKKGKKANICVFKASSPAELLYHFGINQVKDVYIDGKLCVEDQRLCF